MDSGGLRIAVVGVGAVGGYFGGRLLQAGESVSFVARGKTLRALRANGLRLESPQGNAVLSNLEATDSPVEIGAVDVVIVAVKAWQVPGIAESIHPLVGRDTVILPLQNGVEAADQLAAVCGKERVLGGICRIVAAADGEGHVKHVGVEPFIALGELDNHRSSRTARLVETLRRAGIAADNPADIQASIWKKFLFIAPVSGVAAVARAPLGVIRAIPETRSLVEQAMGEVSDLARSKRISLSAHSMRKTLEFLDTMPAESTCSMQRDIMGGRPSELDAINGAVVRLGRVLGIDTPVNQFIHASLLPTEVKAREVESAR